MSLSLSLSFCLSIFLVSLSPLLFSVCVCLCLGLFVSIRCLFVDICVVFFLICLVVVTSLGSLRQMQQATVQKLFPEKKGRKEEEKKLEAPKASSGEGKKEAGECSDKKKAETTKECLICRSVIHEYIIFPNCKIPHIYCVNCAEKMLTMPQQKQPFAKPRGQTPKSLKCVFCQAISPLDERGLNAFKRTCRKPTTSFKTGLCERHPEQPIHYYCLDCEVPACWDCSRTHATHRFDTLEAAVQRSKQDLTSYTEKLTNTQKMLVEYKASLKEERVKVLENKVAKEAELSEHIIKIREMLEQAETKLTEGIDQTEKGRSAPLESEANWAREKIELTETSIDAINHLICFENSLEFFQQLNQRKEALTDAKNITAKKPPPFRPFPPLPTRGLMQALQYVNYTSHGPQFDILHSSADDEEWDSDVDDDGDMSLFE